MLEIDGSKLSGGGQIVRTALALSAHTNKPFRITNIRANRPEPGLKPQHVEAAKTMRRLCNADTEGLHYGSEELSFKPRGFTPEPLDIHIGTAGAITLLVQALALPAMHHKKTAYTVHGGTDVRWSPPIDYLRYVIAPHLRRYGRFEAELKRRGYYPKGGGAVAFTLGQRREPEPVTLVERGVLEQVTVVCNASQDLLDTGVLEDVERSVRVHLDDLGVPITVRNEYANTQNAGWGVLAYATHNLGEPRVLVGADVLGDEVGGPQEAAAVVAKGLREKLSASGAVDEHLADHLVPFLALHGGEFTATRVSSHVRANIAVSELFTDANFTVDGAHVTVSRPA